MVVADDNILLSTLTEHLTSYILWRRLPATVLSFKYMTLDSFLTGLRPLCNYSTLKNIQQSFYHVSFYYVYRSERFFRSNLILWRPYSFVLLLGEPNSHHFSMTILNDSRLILSREEWNPSLRLVVAQWAEPYTEWYIGSLWAHWGSMVSHSSIISLIEAANVSCLMLSSRLTSTDI